MVARNTFSHLRLTGLMLPEIGEIDARKDVLLPENSLTRTGVRVILSEQMSVIVVMAHHLVKVAFKEKRTWQQKKNCPTDKTT